MSDRTAVLRGFPTFARACGVALRDYQIAPALAILDSVKFGLGRSFVVMMARQAGKNELSALIEAYLLVLFSRVGGQIVKASPTFQPQVVNSMRRLGVRFPLWVGLRRREGFIYECGAASCMFLSAAPGANVVGATASLLLEADEAQDIDGDKWRKDFLPMAASTNATTVYWGTAWTDRTLLAQVARGLPAEQVFVADADAVAASVPAYGHYVAGKVREMGRNHPLIRTQYYLETVDAAGSLFTEERQRAMCGGHSRPFGPDDGRLYVLLVDVGGGEESAGAGGVERALNARKDATAATVVEVVPGGALPTYRVVDRRLWLGVGHVRLHAQLADLANYWRAARVVVDATGLGHGLSARIAADLGERVQPFAFTQASKSMLGWRFLALVEAGRWQEYAEDGRPETRQFWYEVGACEFEAMPGGGLRWGVWETPRYDGLVARGHDDLLMSAALVAAYEAAGVFHRGETEAVERVDPVAEADRGGF